MNDRCRSCNRKLIWGKNEKGRIIPLDAFAPVYLRLEDGTFYRAQDGAFVSHFSTCPHASQWSSKKQEEVT